MVTTGDPGNQRSFRGNFWVSSVVLGKVGACGDEGVIARIIKVLVSELIALTQKQSLEHGY